MDHFLKKLYSYTGSRRSSTNLIHFLTELYSILFEILDHNYNLLKLTKKNRKRKINSKFYVSFLVK